MAEASGSRTHRRRETRRPPVLKTGKITGPYALPCFCHKERFHVSWTSHSCIARALCHGDTSKEQILSLTLSRFSPCETACETLIRIEAFRVSSLASVGSEK